MSASSSDGEPGNITPHAEAFQAVVWHLLVSSSRAQGGADEMGEHQIVSAKNACVFLDRDGVLNKSVVREGKPYPPSTLDEFKLYRDVPAGCARLKAAGFLLIVVTNQPDVGRGTQTRAMVEALNEELKSPHPGARSDRGLFSCGRSLR